MTQPSTSSRATADRRRYTNVSDAFRRALPLLESVFREYSIPEPTAKSTETDLAAWFIRYCRRNPESSADASILALLSLACSFARGHARSQAWAGIGSELAALLKEAPETVAARIAASAGIGAPVQSSGTWARLLSFGRGKASA